MNEALCSVVRTLAQAESEILLLARSHPTNWQALTATLPERWTRGDRREPAFEFRRAPDFKWLRTDLAAARRRASEQGPFGELLARRATELESDAELAEQIGSAKFRAFAQRRYALGDVNGADELALSWCRLDAESESGPRVASDDWGHPMSLVNQLQTQMSNCGVSIPIRVDQRLAAVATVDRDCVWVRAGEQLFACQASRIALHEVHGHVLRRIAARQPENYLSSSGFELCDEDEEGRAIWLEETAGLLDSVRKAELGRRHLAASACLQGAKFVETVELLLSADAPLKQALNTALRVWRGGGLAREVIYLRAYLRVRSKLSNSQPLEEWMQRGRYSIDVAAKLATAELVLP